jgi:hypothetical protein
MGETKPLSSFFNKLNIVTTEISNGCLNPSEEAEFLSLIDEARGCVADSELDLMILDSRTYMKDSSLTGKQISSDYMFFIPVVATSAGKLADDEMIIFKTAMNNSEIFKDYRFDLFEGIFSASQIPKTIREQMDFYNGYRGSFNHSSSSLLFVAGIIQVKVYEQEHLGNDYDGSESLSFAENLNALIAINAGQNLKGVKGVCFDPATLLLISNKTEITECVNVLSNECCKASVSNQIDHILISSPLGEKKVHNNLIRSYFDSFELENMKLFIKSFT